ncbi:MAG: hypothetical protein Q4F69_00670 [Bacteroidia bacterium]|nr:hypothetical protein [Bacteroidia bacterium]
MRNISSLYKSAVNRIGASIARQRDFRTTRHIVVIESDDWGSIRMSNRKDWQELLDMGYAVDKRPYERFDTLESPTDIEALYDVLKRHKDAKGNYPIITANMLVANPDFEKIKSSNYSEYYFEPVNDTYKRYFGDTKVLDLMCQGMDEGLIMPQSHSREHFNVCQWMRALQNGDEDVLTAFRYNMCGIAPKAHPEKGNQMMVALKSMDEMSQQQVLSIVDEGLTMFEELWGFKSKSFIAPCYTWNRKIEEVLHRHGVELIQGGRVWRLSDSDKTKHVFMGQHNRLGQMYGVRNCSFEPSTDKNYSTTKLMKEVDNAFAHHKIAVISAHRINFVGGIDINNRVNNLKRLDEFLTTLLKTYPDVEFLSSDKLLEKLFKIKIK